MLQELNSDNLIPLFSIPEWYEKLEKEIYEWIGTPYRPTWGVKQVGCDCNSFVGGVLYNLGILQKLELHYYPNCWWEVKEQEELIKFYWQQHYKQFKPEFEAQFLPFDLETELMPGDLLHFSLLGGKLHIINHSAWLLKNNRIAHAIQNYGVTIEPLSDFYFKRIRRYTRFFLREK